MHLFQQHAPADMDAAAAQIPVIDLGPYFAGESRALEALGAEIRHACETVGFFYIANHGVPQELIDRTFEQSKRFHALPLEEKLTLRLDPCNIGYLPMNASVQGHSTVHKATRPNQNESFFVTHEPDSFDRPVPLRGRNQWPDGLPGFREGVLEYFNTLNALAQRMLPGFAVALGMPAAYFAPFFTEGAHATLRLLHYPPTNVEDNDFGTGPHTDNAFMTILARMEVPGLALRLPSGEWVVPPLIPGTYLVNIGNFLRRMSNDRFLSTPHGVIVEGARDRYSMAYFHSPAVSNRIAVLPSCIDDDHPAKYEPVVLADLVREFWAANYAHQKGHGEIEPKHRYG
jgi:isopenicillin N synthase-like dioxygenase